MIVIGVDAHKRTHTLVALNAVTGVNRGEKTIPATDGGVLDALRFAAALDEERVWAVEDCRHVTSRLERALLGAGERVIRVPPALTGESRKATRTPGKSDPIDARAVALAAIREGVETLPVAFLDEQAHEIRVLCDYRDQLMGERIRLISRLRWHLVRIAPEIEAQLGPAALKGPRIRARLARQLGQLPASPQLRVAKAQLRRINDITKEQVALFAELTDLIKAHAPQLLEQRSIGTVTAAVIIGRTAGAQRFRSEACFARHAGTAPIPATSGNTVRYRLHRGGDRQLNRAIHIIALGRVAWDPDTRAYIQRKQAEGKTKLEAIRCLKRHLARQIWHLLYTNQPPTPTPAPPPIAAVPGLMPCVR
ncbi:MAG TPA: IS110 family transposase [Solirubrobacteraceae bacterium]|nr:IS110 family transposase [Solirubrobacteraceae bacterium]